MPTKIHERIDSFWDGTLTTDVTDTNWIKGNGGGAWGINILDRSVKSVVNNFDSGRGILTADDTDTNRIEGTGNDAYFSFDILWQARDLALVTFASLG